MKWNHRQNYKAYHPEADNNSAGKAASSHITCSKDIFQQRPVQQQVSIEFELIKLAQQGNPDAFGELYKLHLDAIYSYIYKRLGEVSEAENLTQTVFLRAWQALARYQSSEVPFRAWLHRIAHNAVIDHYRTRKETISLTNEKLLYDHTNMLEDKIVSQERYQLLRQAITTLRPNYQQVLSLRFLNGLNYDEAAQVLGRNVNAVRVLQFRALEALHKVLVQEKALTHEKQRNRPTRQMFSQNRSRKLQFEGTSGEISSIP